MRHILAKTAALGLALLAAAPDGHAQTSDQKTALSIYGSTLQYHGDLGSEWFKSNKIEYGFGLNVNRYVVPGLDLGLALSYGDMKFNADPPKNALYSFQNRTVRGFDANVVNIGIPIKLKLN
ncbi:MAG TPA: OmpA family protein, partial [Hymenobacter sp.]